VPVDRTPIQTNDDWSYMNDLAERSGYVFYVDPGPAPLTNTMYFGPRIRPGIQQMRFRSIWGRRPTPPI